MQKKSKISLTAMPGGRKPKIAWHNCNISGLQNQPRPSPNVSEHSNHMHLTPPQSQALSGDGDESDLDLLIHFDSLNTQYASESHYREHTKNNFAEAEEHAH